MKPEDLFPIFTGTNIILFNLVFWTLMLWSLVWKGIALWQAARNGSKRWFVVLLIFNTLGILEILYIFVFSPKSEKSRSGNLA